MIPEIMAIYLANVACGMPTRNMPEHSSPQVRVTPSHKGSGHMAGPASMLNHTILRWIHHMGISMVISICNGNPLLSHCDSYWY